MWTKRTALGGAAFAGIFIVLAAWWDNFVGVSWSSRDLAPHIFWLIAALCGALIARGRFLVPAVSIWAVISGAALTLVRLNDMVQVSWAALLQENAVGIAGSLAAVLIGIALAEAIRRLTRVKPAAA